MSTYKARDLFTSMKHFLALKYYEYQLLFIAAGLFAFKPLIIGFFSGF